MGVSRLLKPAHQLVVFEAALFQLSHMICCGCLDVKRALTELYRRARGACEQTIVTAILQIS